MHCLKSASTSVTFRQCFCQHNYYCGSQNQSSDDETSPRRNRVLVESSPSGCEPPRQIVWKRAVMWSRTKRRVSQRQKKIGQGRCVSLGRPSVSIVLSDTHQYVHDISAYQVSFVSTSHLTGAANKAGSWENFVTAVGALNLQDLKMTDLT